MTFIFACVVLFVQFGGLKSDVGGEEVPKWVPRPVVGTMETIGSEINSTSFMSVNHYFCEASEFKDSVMIMYGTKSWTFPIQDVNLTLSYPTANADPDLLVDEGYIISKFKVILYIDGKHSTGYIMHGGVLKESIVLSFVCSNITSLSYEFWLYGVPKQTYGTVNELFNRSYVCG